MAHGCVAALDDEARNEAEVAAGTDHLDLRACAHGSGPLGFGALGGLQLGLAGVEGRVAHYEVCSFEVQEGERDDGDGGGGGCLDEVDAGGEVRV